MLGGVAPYAAFANRHIVLAPATATPAVAVLFNSSRLVVRLSATSAYASSMRCAGGVLATWCPPRGRLPGEHPTFAMRVQVGRWIDRMRGAWYESPRFA